MAYKVNNFNKSLTLGELVEKLDPYEAIIAEYPSGKNRWLNRYSHLDKIDAELLIIGPYLYDSFSKTYRVKVKPTETGIHWDITNYHYGIDPLCTVYLENDRKIVSEFLNMIYNNPNHIDKIISQPPATIIFWGNGEKTVVKTEPDDEYDLEKGILYAILKHVSTKKDYDHYLRTIDEEDSPLSPDETEETPKKKREHKYQKCPVCGQGYNLNWSRTSKLSKQGFVDIRCSGCDTLFKVKGDWNLPKWWTKLEHAVVIKGKGAISNGETN